MGRRTDCYRFMGNEGGGLLRSDYIFRTVGMLSASLIVACEHFDK
jgi:hypothetical protein